MDLADGAYTRISRVDDLQADGLEWSETNAVRGRDVRMRASRFFFDSTSYDYARLPDGQISRVETLASI